MLTFLDNPFRKPSADLVVASSDNVAFRVHRSILAEASLVFEQMLSLPRPQHSLISQSEADEEFDGLPVVRLTEHSAILDPLFRLCYPIKDPILANVRDVGEVLEAAVKYDMMEATDLMTERLMAFAETQPLQVYAIACQHGLEAIAFTAAKAVYAKGLSVTYFAEMETLSAGAYYRLCHYCKSRKKGKSPKQPHFCRSKSPRRDSLSDISIAAADVASPTHLFTMPNADVIIRSSDGIEFRVHRFILELSSPILSTQLAHAVSLQEQQASTDLPIVELGETSRTVSVLLQICYPMPEPVLEDVHETVLILAAAQKYKMEKAVPLLSAKLLAANAEPLKVYLLACRFGLAGQAIETVAKRSLCLDEDEQDTYHAEMEGVAAGPYFRLLQYYRAYREVVERYTSDGQWISAQWRERFRSICSSRNNGLFLPCWCTVYFRLLRDLKFGDFKAHSGSHSGSDMNANVVEATYKRLSVSTSCSNCRSTDVVFLMLQFGQYLVAEFEIAVSKLELDWK